MDLQHALSILSKSSPYAVSTEKTSDQDKLASYKSYIYIKTDIESDFKQALISVKSNEIIFLCGSSGDGKSEILTRYSQQFKTTRDFHLDATHSFNPNQTAIHTLDERFREFKENGKPLVVGINIGMLGNYAQEGSENHQEIRNAFKAFLGGKRSEIPNKYRFLDFEEYPKFTFSDKGNTSDFAYQFIQRLTAPIESNPFFILQQNQIEKSGYDHVTLNFGLLGKESVQLAVIELLLKTRLVKDQFLTARALLDFVFQIIVRKGYLFDNLFAGGDNELLSRIVDFDPSNIHTKRIDTFILQQGLSVEDPKLDLLKSELEKDGLFFKEDTCPASYLRLFFVLRHDCTEGDIVHEFRSEFDDHLIEQYASIWLLHQNFDGSGKQRQQLAKFYREVLILAIHRYSNRHATELDKDTFFLSNLNGYVTAAELELKPDFKQVQFKTVKKLGTFNAYLEINGKAISPVPVSINMMELMIKITQGYRPNKHDKSSVLLLEEIIEQLHEAASERGSLIIFKDDKRYKVTSEDGFFEISGL